MRTWLVWIYACASGLAACSGDTAPPADGTCRTNKDCAEGEACVGGACIAGKKSGCDNDDQCDFGQVCNPNSKMCEVAEVVVCTNDQGCPADKMCNTITGVCVFRQPPPDGGVIIDPDGGVTVPDTGIIPSPGDTCVDDTQCAPPATVCKGTMCAVGCAQPGGGSCPSGQVCDSNTGHCVSISGPCQNDTQCNPPSTVCESMQCIPGCTQTGGLQCSGGMICNPNSGRCGPNTGPICASDLDCSAPTTVCNLFSGACDPGCGTAGCTSPATCDGATGHCTSATPCNPDRFEPNNARNVASNVNNGTQIGLSTCAGDEDWYVVTLGAGDDITTSITFVHGDGNLDLELYDAGGTVVGSSRTNNGTESITYTSAAGGQHFVRVIFAQDLGPNPGNTYSLQIMANVAPCNTDPYEPNNDSGSSQLISDGSETGLNVCTGDDDFYKIFLTQGETITVTVDFNNAEGDIDLALLGLFGLTLDSSSSSGNQEVVSYTVQASLLAVTIQVTLYSDTGTMQGNPYSMSVVVTTGGGPGPMCLVDSMEPNETRAAAPLIGSGNYTNLGACSGNDDFYELDLSSGGTTTIHANFNNAEGDVDLFLWDPNDTVVGRSETTTNDEEIVYTPVVSGFHAVRVNLYGDAGSTPGNTYSLSISP